MKTRNVNRKKNTKSRGEKQGDSKSSRGNKCRNKGFKRRWMVNREKVSIKEREGVCTERWEIKNKNYSVTP